VIYVAAKPPRSIFKSIASRVGRTVIYIPIGQLSPVSLKKIRVVHVLDGYEKRETAKDYLW
jgi:NAD-dependent DNA ligase